MLNKPLASLALLLCLPLLVWSRLALASEAVSDTLPLLFGLPMFFWLGAPWRLVESPRTIPKGLVAGCSAGLLFGFASGITLVFTVSWVGLLWLWGRAYVAPRADRKLSRLLLIPFFALPWIVLDGHSLGWTFRLSGAWCAEQALQFAGESVTREGTLLYVNHLCVSVGAGCAGLNTLQSMLLGGSVLAFVMLHSSRLFWWHLPIIIVAAWLANTLRIMVTAVVAATVGAQYASGAFHEWEGWAVLLAMFLLSAGAFSLLQSLQGREVVEAAA